MIQLGIRLHDVNTACGPELQTMQARARTARQEGFSCVHPAGFSPGRSWMWRCWAAI